MFLAAFVGVNRDIVNLDVLADIRLDILADVIPAGILKEATDISVGLYAEYASFYLGFNSTYGGQQREKDKVPYDAFSVGLQLKNEGLKAEHPVIMVGECFGSLVFEGDREVLIAKWRFRFLGLYQQGRVWFAGGRLLVLV